MTVSSMSEMIPKRTPEATTNTGMVTGAASSTVTSTRCQPGSRSASTRTSSTPPRSARTTCRLGSGDHDDLGVAHGNADEAAPAAQIGEAVRLRGVSFREHDPTEHPHPAVAAVARERDHRGDQAATAAAALAERVEDILDPRRQVRDRTLPVLRGNH